jgi:hypothetical protein
MTSVVGVVRVYTKSLIINYLYIYILKSIYTHKLYPHMYWFFSLKKSLK